MSSMTSLASEKSNQIKALLDKALGKPSYSRPGVFIYQMDCIEGMKQLPEALIDLTVTSPPYNIGKEYEQITDVTDYVAWCEKWLSEISRICVPNGSFWLNVGYLRIEGQAKALPIPYLLWDKISMFLVQEIVWNYGAGVASKLSFSPRNEKFLWYVNDEKNYTFNLDDVRYTNVKYPNQKKNGKLRCNPLGKNPTDVWEFPKVTSGANRSSPERTAHPAQFPISLIDRIIKASSNAGDIILDPFMGSGTTAEAALANNRIVIGFELDSKYIDIASDRLEYFAQWRDSELAQQPLPVFEQQPKLATLDFG
jgi:adenine-specific DNA-methyltransferase